MMTSAREFSVVPPPINCQHGHTSSDTDSSYSPYTFSSHRSHAANDQWEKNHRSTGNNRWSAFAVSPTRNIVALKSKLRMTHRELMLSVRSFDSSGFSHLILIDGSFEWEPIVRVSDELSESSSGVDLHRSFSSWGGGRGLDVGFIETYSEKGNKRMRGETRPRTKKNDFEHCFSSLDVLSYFALVFLCATASPVNDRVNSSFSCVKYKMQGEKTTSEKKPNWAERVGIGMGFHQ